MDREHNYWLGNLVPYFSYCNGENEQFVWPH